MEYVLNNDPLLSPDKGSENFVTHDLPLFKHFPSPFLDDISTTQLAPAPPQHNNHLMAETNTNIFHYPNKALNIDSTELSSSTSTATCSTTPEIMTPKKKKRRSGKKDRHSKIRTVHGLRDRRMRLSLEISRKFFDLQDMLGFDKASKTIDWLFSKSKKAIKEVTQTFPLQLKSNNQASICVGKRGNQLPLSKRESGLEITAKSKARLETREASKSKNLAGADERKPRKSRETTLINNPHVARESREKARARAKERTREKMMIKCLKEKSVQCEWFEANVLKSNLGKLGLRFTKNPNVDKLGSSGDPFEPSCSSHCQDRHFFLDDQFANVEIIQKLLGTSCSAFGYQKSSAAASGSMDSSNKLLEFLENRDAMHLRVNPNTNLDQFTAATIQGENPSYFPTSSFCMNVHSQHLGERSVQFP